MVDFQGQLEERGPSFLKPTNQRVLRVWWAFFWPQLVATIAIELAGPHVTQWIVERGYLSAKTLQSAAPLFWIWFWLTLMIGAMDYAIGRKFRDFRVALVPAKGGEPKPLDRTFARVGRVSWRFFWLSLVYGIAFGIVLYLPAMLIAESFGPQQRTLEAIQNVLGTLLGAGTGFYVFKNHIIDDFFDDVRVRLLPIEPNSTPTQANAAVGPAVS